MPASLVAGRRPFGNQARCGCRYSFSQRSRAATRRLRPTVSGRDGSFSVSSSDESIDKVPLDLDGAPIGSRPRAQYPRCATNLSVAGPDAGLAWTDSPVRAASDGGLTISASRYFQREFPPLSPRRRFSCAPQMPGLYRHVQGSSCFTVRLFGRILGALRDLGISAAGRGGRISHRLAGRPTA